MDFWKMFEVGLIVLFTVFFIGLCIFVHELGHFLVAKWRGLHIVAFSLGFRKMWAKKVGDVEYRIGMLPFGGYVELPQLDSTGPAKLEDGTVLPEASPLDRMLTAFAGPFFNILFGLLLGCAVWIVGIPQDTPRMRSIEVAVIDEKGPEYEAGLRAGDRIVRVNGDAFFGTWSEFVQKLLFTVGRVKLDVERGGKPFAVEYQPRYNPNAPESMRREQVAWPFFTARIPIELYPERNSQAQNAGILAGDILLEIDGTPVEDFQDYQQRINLSEGKPLTFKLRRNGQTVTVRVTPGAIPDAELEPEEKDNYKIGIVYSAAKLPLKVLHVIPAYPAAQSGMRAGDEIVSFDGRPITSVGEFQKQLTQLKDTPFTLGISRGGKNIAYKLACKLIRPYTIGARVTVIDHPNPFQQLAHVAVVSYKSLRGIVYFVGNKVGLTEQASTIKPRNMSGPIGLARAVFITVYYGSWIIGINFVVFISFALAIFNLLPLPVLDGGHVTLSAIEMAIRRPLPAGVIRYLSYVFVVLLVALMLYVSYFDILRMVPIKPRTAPEPAKIEQKTPTVPVPPQKEASHGSASTQK